MADLYPAEPAEAMADAKPPEAADLNAEKATLFGTLAHLWPYIWPGDRFDLKMRVVWSMVLLLIAKAATLFVPFTFKWAVDALTGADTAPVQSSNWMLWLIASPLIMTLSYGAIRIVMMHRVDYLGCALAGVRPSALAAARLLGAVRLLGAGGGLARLSARP